MSPTHGSVSSTDQQGGEPVRSTFRPGWIVDTVDDYRDQSGNQWVIRISGKADVVRVLREQGQVIVGAEPLSEGEWRELVTEFQRYRHDRRLYARTTEVPSLDIYASLANPANLDHRFWRITYAVHVPLAGHSVHQHTVDVGGDHLAHVTFEADTSAITVRMGGDSQSGLKGEVNWETRSTAISLTVSEQGTGYRLNGDGVTPPA